jgi:hypothetical protein
MRAIRTGDNTQSAGPKSCNRASGVESFQDKAGMLAMVDEVIQSRDPRLLRSDSQRGL